MSCRLNPSSVDSANVWLLPSPIYLSLHILRFIHGLLICFNRDFLSICFPSISWLSTTSEFSLLYTTSLFALCFVIPIPSCGEQTPTYIHMPVGKNTPDTTHNLLWHLFQIHVAPQAIGTVHYLPLLLVTFFFRHYYGGRGCR